jgi:hypothetical protein
VPHLLHVFPSFETGGQQIRMVTLANRLAARAGTGFSHSVVALDGRTDCADLLAPGVPVRLVGGPGRGLRAAWSMIRGEAPDMLLTHNWGSMEWVAANRLAGVPHLHFEDGFGPDESGARQLRRRVLARRVLLSAPGSRTIVPSRTLGPSPPASGGCRGSGCNGCRTASTWRGSRGPSTPPWSNASASSRATWWWGRSARCGRKRT